MYTALGFKLKTTLIACLLLRPIDKGFQGSKKYIFIWLNLMRESRQGILYTKHRIKIVTAIHWKFIFWVRSDFWELLDKEYKKCK